MGTCVFDRLLISVVSHHSSKIFAALLLDLIVKYLWASSTDFPSVYRVAHLIKRSSVGVVECHLQVPSSNDFLQFDQVEDFEGFEIELLMDF